MRCPASARYAQPPSLKGRPYRGKDELLQKKILTQSVYDGIKDKIIARQNTNQKKKK